MICWKKKRYWKKNRLFIKSEVDLKLFENQIIYVEGSYNEEVNKVFLEKYDEIASKMENKIANKYFPLWRANLLYLPNFAKQIEKSGDLFSEILNYYYPNTDKPNTSSQLSAVPQTATISQLLLPNEEDIKPGLLRYIERDKEGRFVYEYFQFASDDKYSIEKQINHYISKITFKYYSTRWRN